MTEIKRLGVLTSGGDCAGLNAAIRAVVFRAIQTYGWQVFGIREGTQGLLRRPLDYDSLSVEVFGGELLRQGGTILGTTTSGDPFAYPMPDGSLQDRSAEVIEGYRLLGLDALIAICGDGSIKILRRLAAQGGINLVVVPKTIDNDIPFTENSIGYATAVAVATEALDRLQPTAASHSRVMVLEVMGRDAGHIALAAGIAGGADVILIPEIPYRMDSIVAKLDTLMTRAHRNFALVVVAEAVKTVSGDTVGVALSGGGVRLGGVGHSLGAEIHQRTGAQTRVTVLGHLQRGGAPIASDRVYASAFGVHAVDLVAQGKFDRMVAWGNRNCLDVALDAVQHSYHPVDLDGAMVRTARGLGICLGD